MSVIFWGIVASIFTLPAIWINNYELIMAESGLKARIRCMFRRRKNLIATIFLGVIAGIGFSLMTFSFYDSGILDSLKLLFIYIWLIPIAYIDGKTRRIPNRWIIYGLFAWLVFFLMEGTSGGGWLGLIDRTLTGALLGGGIFLLAVVISRGGIGMGDAKMYMVLGLMLGGERVLYLVLFGLSGALAYSFIMILLKRMNRKAMIPLGPFTYMAIVIMLLCGI